MSIVQSVPVAVRRALARRPWIYWLGVALVVLWLVVAVHARVARTDAARDAWGAHRAVLVATNDLAPGDTLAVEMRQAPVALVPDQALVDAATAGDVLVRQHIMAGEIVTEADVGLAAGVMGLVPAGWVAVTVVESPVSGVAPGDRVRLSSDGLVIVDEALIVGTTESATTIAVPAGVAPLVPVAARAGTLDVLRLP
jgi:hypothetical protein